MDMWFANRQREDTQMAPSSIYVDIDVGKDNDYKLSLSTSEYNKDNIMPGGYFYIPGEEYGGKIQDLSVNTSSGTVSFTGDTFRGMLNERFVEPPAGQDYLTVTGDMHSVMRSIVGAHFGNLFVVSSDPRETVTCKILRYCSVLEALEQIASSKEYRLEIKAVVDEKFYVLLSAEKIRNLSEDIEVSQDYGINFEISKVSKKYEYMLALGSGELKDRVVKRYHMTSNGTIETVASFPVDAIVYKYDYPNAESEEQLLEEATKKFSEINQTDSQKMRVRDDLELKMGDIVAGRDYVTGVYISEPVSRIIVKYSNSILSKSYEIGVI